MGPNHNVRQNAVAILLGSRVTRGLDQASMLWLSKLPQRWAAALARGRARGPVDNRWLIGRLVEVGGNRAIVDA
jgi:hypothetical protein